MNYQVMNNDKTDRVNYGKVVQIINQAQLDRWRKDSREGRDVPIGMYIITPLKPKTESRPRRNTKASWNRWAERHEFDIQCD